MRTMYLNNITGEIDLLKGTMQGNAEIGLIITWPNAEHRLTFSADEISTLFRAMYGAEPNEFLMPASVAQHISDLEHQNEQMRTLLVAKFPCIVCLGRGVLCLVSSRVNVFSLHTECESCHGLGFEIPEDMRRRS